VARPAGIEPTTFSSGGLADSVLSDWNGSNLGNGGSSACTNSCADASQEQASQDMIDALRVLDMLPLTSAEKATVVRRIMAAPGPLMSPRRLPDR
jgi:hypothetical protein